MESIRKFLNFFDLRHERVTSLTRYLRNASRPFWFVRSSDFPIQRDLFHLSLSPPLSVCKVHTNTLRLLAPETFFLSLPRDSRDSSFEILIQRRWKIYFQRSPRMAVCRYFAIHLARVSPNRQLTFAFEIVLHHSN